MVFGFVRQKQVKLLKKKKKTSGPSSGEIEYDIEYAKDGSQRAERPESVPVIEEEDSEESDSSAITS
jgi:hypothetical protein